MSASPEQPHSFSPEEIAQRIEHFGATFDLDVMKQAASLIRAQSERERVLVDACTDALALLKKGAPGWGVAKDILRIALAKAQP